jgi:TPR repeat protein
LSNYVAAVLYLVAGLLLLLAGLTVKQVENISEDSLKKKKLILSMIGIGITMVVGIIVYFILKDSPEKQATISNEVTIEEQVSESEPTLSPSDMFELGEKYYFDDKNYTEAAKWYRKSAEEGYAKAQYELGYMYYDGEGIEKDYSEALKWLRKSADQGNSDAQNALGHMYYLGDGVTENFSEAVKWYRKGAEQGNKYAQYNLGQMYEYGNGIAQDYSKAIEWYQKAAKQGHEKAKDKLEYLLESGE